jgi:hypothetical protein
MRTLVTWAAEIGTPWVSRGGYAPFPENPVADKIPVEGTQIRNLKLGRLIL